MESFRSLYNKYVSLAALLSAATVFLLSSCDGSRHAQMQRELAALQAMNQADSVLTDDSLAQDLADWMDGHGTPNEQMEAHYLLGRTLADRGEAPAALAAYHDATDRADTTAADCDYRLLSRVYAQMANLFYQQGLMPDFLDCLNHAIASSEKNGDTLTATNMMAHKMEAYERMDKPDTVIMIYENVFKRLCDMGYRQDAASYSGLVIGSYLEKGQTAKVEECLRIYEAESGFFMGDGNIVSGREAYYNLRGRYHLAMQEYDSAFYYFRKELLLGKDYNNQNGASRWLALLYQQTGKPDSAAKYALYSYAMNDSMYTQMATSDVERMHQMYNYTRHQKIAQEERLRAEEEEKRAKTLKYAIVVICIAVILAFRYLYYRRQALKKRYEEAKEELGKVSGELRMLKEQKESFAQLKKAAEARDEKEEKWKRQENDLRTLIASKEKEAERLKAKIATMKARLSIYVIKNSGDKQNGSEAYTFIQTVVGRREKMTEDEWDNLSLLISKERPELHEFLYEKKREIGIPGYRICLLMSQPIRVKDAANLMGTKPPYISKISTDALFRLWGQQGSSKELQVKLQAK